MCRNVKCVAKCVAKSVAEYENICRNLWRNMKSVAKYEKCGKMSSKEKCGKTKSIKGQTIIIFDHFFKFQSQPTSSRKQIETLIQAHPMSTPPAKRHKPNSSGPTQHSEQDYREFYESLGQSVTRAFQLVQDVYRAHQARQVAEHKTEEKRVVDLPFEVVYNDYEPDDKNFLQHDKVFNVSGKTKVHVFFLGNTLQKAHRFLQLESNGIALPWVPTSKMLKKGHQLAHLKSLWEKDYAPVVKSILLQSLEQAHVLTVLCPLRKEDPIWSEEFRVLMKRPTLRTFMYDSFNMYELFCPNNAQGVRQFDREAYEMFRDTFDGHITFACGFITLSQNEKMSRIDYTTSTDSTHPLQEYAQILLGRHGSLTRNAYGDDLHAAVAEWVGPKTTKFLEEYADVIFYRVADQTPQELERQRQCQIEYQKQNKVYVPPVELPAELLQEWQAVCGLSDYPQCKQALAQLDPIVATPEVRALVVRMIEAVRRGTECGEKLDKRWENQYRPSIMEPVSQLLTGDVMVAKAKILPDDSPCFHTKQYLPNVLVKVTDRAYGQYVDADALSPEDRALLNVKPLNCRRVVFDSTVLEELRREMVQLISA